MAQSLAQFFVELKATGQTELVRALTLIQREIDQNVSSMQRLAVAMRPEVVRERVASTVALEEAQRRLNVVMREEYEKYGAWVEKAPSALDRWHAALRQLHSEQEAFAQSAAMQRVREQYGTWVEKAPTALDRWRSALKSVNQELQAQKDALARVQAAMDPRTMEERVRLQVKMEKAQEAYNRALEAERRRQGAGGGLLGQLGRLIQGRGGLAGSVAGLFGGGGSALAVGGPVGAIAAVASQVVNSIQRMYQAMVGLVASANPAVVELYHRAWADLGAVVGRTLVPIVKMATEVVRVFGDFLANILPSASEWSKVMQQIRPALDEMRNAIMDLAPTIRAVLVGMIRTAAVAIGAMAKQLALVIKVAQMMPQVALAKALFGGKEEAKATSMGAAASQARYVDIEEIGRQAALSAYSQGAGGPDVQTADNTRSAAATLKSILDHFRDYTLKRLTASKSEAAQGGIAAGLQAGNRGW